MGAVRADAADDGRGMDDDVGPLVVEILAHRDRIAEIELGRARRKQFFRLLAEDALAEKAAEESAARAAASAETIMIKLPAARKSESSRKIEINLGAEPARPSESSAAATKVEINVALQASPAESMLSVAIHTAPTVVSTVAKPTPLA